MTNHFVTCPVASSSPVILQTKGYEGEYHEHNINKQHHCARKG